MTLEIILVVLLISFIAFYIYNNRETYVDFGTVVPNIEKGVKNIVELPLDTLDRISQDLTSHTHTVSYDESQDSERSNGVTTYNYIQSPTPKPTQHPTPIPTQHPTPIPTQSPTPIPTQSPTPIPTYSPTPIPKDYYYQAPLPPPTPMPTTPPIQGKSTPPPLMNNTTENESIQIKEYIDNINNELSKGISDIKNQLSQLNQKEDIDEENIRNELSLLRSDLNKRSESCDSQHSIETDPEQIIRPFPTQSPLPNPTQPPLVTPTQPPLPTPTQTVIPAESTIPYEIVIPESIDKREKEVFNVDQNIFTYDDAPLVCKAFGGRLANLNEVIDAHKKGANWCNYGWSQNQMALYPIQKSFYNELQQGPVENRGDCGKPGINGGYFANKNLKFGVNCYGYKPKPEESKILYIDNHTLEEYPELYDQFNYNHNCQLRKKYDNIKDMIDNKKLDVLPFNENKWKENTDKISKYLPNYNKNNTIKVPKPNFPKSCIVPSQKNIQCSKSPKMCNNTPLSPNKPIVKRVYCPRKQEFKARVYNNSDTQSTCSSY